MAISQEEQELGIGTGACAENSTVGEVRKRKEEDGNRGINKEEQESSGTHNVMSPQNSDTSTPISNNFAKTATIGIEKLEQKAIKLTLIPFTSLPPWARDNSFIETKYRPISNSFRTSLRSLFYLHNESINIYSHLLACFSFLLTSVHLHLTLPARQFSSPPSSSSLSSSVSQFSTIADANLDILVLTVFFLGCISCLLFSSLYHLLQNHSHKICSIGNKLDYLGIVLMISGSYVPSLYYGFPCHVRFFKLYTLQTLLFGVICIALSLHDHFRTPSYRPLRAAMYVLYGLSGIVPLSHGITLYGFEQLSRQISLPYMLVQGFLYILGAGIYAARVPERWWPGRFDLIGASHQIFHFLVVAAAASHLTGLVKAFDYRNGGGESGRGLTCEKWT